MANLTYAFVVQGEGRGHMTQAIALYHLLVSAGHKVCCVFVGGKSRNTIPAYFYNSIQAPIVPFESPYFVKDKNNKHIVLRKTLIYNLLRSPKYYQNLHEIHKSLLEYKPDVVINFYDFLGGLYFRWFKVPFKHVCIGHQFLLEHPDFAFPQNTDPSEKYWYFANSNIVSSRCHKKLALSFRKFANVPDAQLVVVPPLLRDSIFQLRPKAGEFLLVYTVNSGFVEDIIQWHSAHTDVSIHLFSDLPDLADETIVDGNLVLHKLNDLKFLSFMEQCMAYASTAGFESICEAMYLGKPVLMVPPKGHFEQQCNALDAQVAGAGISAESFDLGLLLSYVEQHNSEDNSAFRQWVHTANDTLLHELTHFD